MSGDARSHQRPQPFHKSRRRLANLLQRRQSPHRIVPAEPKRLGGTWPRWHSGARDRGRPDAGLPNGRRSVIGDGNAGGRFDRREWAWA